MYIYRRSLSVLNKWMMIYIWYVTGPQLGLELGEEGKKKKKR